jgi:hypothetical protein
MEAVHFSEISVTVYETSQNIFHELQTLENMLTKLCSSVGIV